MPSDLGFDNTKFVLPKLIEREHIVESKTPAEGYLFPMIAKDFREERAERRRTLKERCELAAKLADDKNQSVTWCHLNDEGDLLSEMMKGSIQVSGRTSEEEKEEIYMGFADGSVKHLIIKPKIGAWGMNWQHCNHVISFASHSYEQYYQAVRRCWRFGQKRDVTVDVICSEGEVGVMKNLKRKAVAADKMFSNLVAMMNDSLKVGRGVKFTKEEEVPTWL